MGPALMAALPLISSAVSAGGQMISGAMKKRQAKAMPMPEQDPNMVAMLAEINQKRRALEQGTGLEADLLKKQVGQGLAQTQKNILSAGGGDVGATMQGLNSANQAAGLAYAQGSQALLQKQGMYQQLANQMAADQAQRQFEVQQSNRLQRMAEGAESMKYGIQNIMPAALGLMNKFLPQGDTTDPNANMQTMSADQAYGAVSSLPQFEGIFKKRKPNGASGIPSLEDLNTMFTKQYEV